MARFFASLMLVGLHRVFPAPQNTWWLSLCLHVNIQRPVRLAKESPNREFTQLLGSRILKSLLRLEPAGISCSSRRLSGLIGLFVMSWCVFPGCARWGVALWHWTQLFRRNALMSLFSTHRLYTPDWECTIKDRYTGLHQHTDRHAQTHVCTCMT